MIIGIGVDIVQIERMERWLEKHKLLERFFHADEIAYAFTRKKKGAAQSLSARFAAKEAFCKALGTGLCGISTKDIAVVNNENGKPQLKLFATAREAFKKSGADKIHITLSHEKNYAIAMIILEGENEE